MEQQFQNTAEQLAAFQKIWTESATKMFQAAFTAAPNSPPPEFLRQIRAGIFAALAQSWDEFMRSPQFLQAMKDSMEQAIAFRKLTNDWLAKVRTELQAPSRGDIDSVMLATRHLEKRVLDRLEQLAAEVKALRASMSGHATASEKRRPGKARPAPAQKRQKVRI